MFFKQLELLCVKIAFILCVNVALMSHIQHVRLVKSYPIILEQHYNPLRTKLYYCQF